MSTADSISSRMRPLSRLSLRWLKDTGPSLLSSGVSLLITGSCCVVTVVMPPAAIWQSSRAKTSETAATRQTAKAVQIFRSLFERNFLLPPERPVHQIKHDVENEKHHRGVGVGKEQGYEVERGTRQQQPKVGLFSASVF